jgi:hypothetical protein
MGPKRPHTPGGELAVRIDGTKTLSREMEPFSPWPGVGKGLPGAADSRQSPGSQVPAYGQGRGRRFPSRRPIPARLVCFAAAMRFLAVIALLTLVSSAWAQFLPPEAFDRPFDGRIVIQEARDRDEVLRLCPNMTFTMEPLGCSHRIPGIKLCTIVKVSDERIRAAGHDPAVFMRHQVGHCNGWPASHKGAR